jgi:hypothetical protein
MTASARIQALLRSAAGSQRQTGPGPAALGMRFMCAARAAYGAVLLCVPGPVISALTAAPASGRARAVARVLGARQVIQAAVCGLAPRRGLIQAGAAVDGLHAGSMLALAGAEPRLRRALLAETAIGAVLASAAATVLRRQPVPRAECASRSATQGSR